MNIYSTLSIIIGLIIACMFVYMRFFVDMTQEIDPITLNVTPPELPVWILFIINNQLLIFLSMIFVSILVVALRWKRFKKNILKYEKVFKHLN